MTPHIALVNMPFASSKRPSLQLGLLKGLAEQAGWRAQTLHLNLDFAVLIGRERYELLCQHRGMQLSDWLFSVAAFGDQAPDPECELLTELPPAYLEALQAQGIDQPLQWLRRLRDTLVPAYLVSALHAVLSCGAPVIGFSSTFQQNTASFALARLLKAAKPELLTIFGGANFDHEMGLEYLRAIPAIDWAVIGEGDEAFPAWLRALAEGADAGAVPGVASRRADGTVRYQANPKPFERLDELPLPDYHEYFARSEALGLLVPGQARRVDLPVEGARGCWWGEKHHCVFCGLNAGTMKFRAKSPERFLSEVQSLSRTYRSLHIETVDNIIDPRYFDSVLPRIEALRASWNIFYEVKSNLGPEQIHALARAGVCRIQPGIESLSSPVLQLMRKGVKAIQNINLLRWCAYDGIRASWNLLWGFPGEQPEHYQTQLALVPWLHHLQPPDGQGRLWMERFSPLYTQREWLGVSDVRPSRSYTQVYPQHLQLDRAAYFFDYQVAGALPEDSFVPLVAALDGWRSQQHGERPATLNCHSAPGYLRIDDQRGLPSDGSYELEGELAELYLVFLERPTGLGQAAQRLDRGLDWVTQGVAEFCERGLMVREGNAALALALPARAA